MPPAARLREEGHQMCAAPSARATPPHTAPCSPDTWGTHHPSPQLPWVCQRKPSAESQGLLRGPLELEDSGVGRAAGSRGGGTLRSAELCYCRVGASGSACGAGHAPCLAGADLARPGSSGDGVAPCTAATACAGLRRGTRDDVTGAVLMSHPDVVAQASMNEGPLGSRGAALGPIGLQRADAMNGNNSHERHPSPSAKMGDASSTRTQAMPCAEGSEGGGAGAEAENNQEPPPHLRSLWHLIRSVAFGEAAVLALFLLLFCSALARPEAVWVVPSSLARLFRLVSLLGIALELLRAGDSLRSQFQLRPGASSGLHLGAMALPATLLARAVLHSAWTGTRDQGSPVPPSCAHIRVSEHVSCAPSVLDLHCWGALSCAASALAGALALRLTRRGLRSSGGTGTSSPRSQANEGDTVGGAADFRTSESAATNGHLPERDTQGVNGRVHPTTAYMSLERQAKTGSVGLITGFSDLGPFFVGWGSASACVAAAAAACWGVPAAWPGLASSPALGPLVWLLCLPLLSSLVFVSTLALFPRSFTAGEAMLASQGLTLYAGDALGLTLARLAPALPLPPFGAPSPFRATGDQIHAIIQAMVLGLLLLPTTGTALARLVASALAQRHTGTNSSDCGNSSEISNGSNGSDSRNGSKAQGQKEGDSIGGGNMSADKGSARGGAAIAGAMREAVVSRAVGFGLGTVLVVCVGAPLWLRWVGGMTQHPVLWALLQVLEDPEPRASLCFYWLATALLPLPLLQRAAAAGAVPRIVLRKAYHLMAVAMFVPALLLQPGFLRLAFGVALCAFLFLEVLRVCQVAPLGPVLDRFMRAFADSRDAGPIIVSHFSLLLGCALPLWLAPYPSAAHPAATSARGPAYLAPFAGILSIGIGDTMASVVGKRYGRHRIARDSPKTVEGTLACVAFTFLACAGLVPALCAIHGCAFGARDWGQVLLATAVSGLLEAYTEQLDNAFVPLLYFASLAVL